MKTLENAPKIRPERIGERVLPARLPVSVQIAGTNGKGSTAAFLAKLLQAHGQRVGLYTSPHMSDFTERIQIDGQRISPKDLERYVHQLNHLQVGMCQSDLLFLAACRYFVDQSVDRIVFETGLGGRKDSATLVPHEFGILTHIDLDHTQLLGNTLEQMTWEKCGIIKPGMCVIAYPNQRMDIIREQAQSRGARLIETGERKAQIEGGSFCLPELGMRGVQLQMLGEHQIKNCICALCCAKQMLGERFDPKIAQAAVESTRLFGRMSVLQAKPLIVLDVAHNPDGINALCAEIDRHTGTKLAVVSIPRGKDYPAMIRRLRASFDQVIFTQAAKNAYHPEQTGEPGTFAEFERAYEYALSQPADVLVFCGSFGIARRFPQ